MSYTYLLELGEEYSVESFLDIPASVLSRLNLTADKSYYNASATESSLASRSGTTCEPSMERRGADSWMSSAVASRAKTSAHNPPYLETMTASTANEADCGGNMPGYLAKYDRATHSLKTRQTLLFEDSTESFVTLPRWGCLLAGELSELTPPDMIISANVSGLLPTVMASDWKGGTTSIRKDRGDQRLDQWRDYVKCKHGLTYPHPTHSELRMGWPEKWTDLKPLGTDKFRQWLQSHGEPCTAN